MGPRIMVPVSTRAWIAAGLVVAGFLVAWNWQGSRYEAKLADLRSAHSQALAEAQERARRIEQGWHATIDEVRKDARENAAAVADDLDSANHELARLREASASRSSRAASNTSTACRSTPATGALILYSELLDSCSARVLDLAGEADRRRVAGLACERYGEVLAGRD